MHLIKKKGKNIIRNIFGDRTVKWIGYFLRVFLTRWRRVIRSFKFKQNIVDYQITIKLIEKNSHLFFGYYDICPFNFNDDKILALRLSKENSNGCLKHKNIDVGYFDLHKKEYIKTEETAAWCWQQGCRLQWYPLEGYGKNDLILYNTLINEKYRCIVQNIETKEIRKVINRPIYSVTPDGKFGLSINFSRLGRLRPGYGYEVLPDETENEPRPENDGIWLIDIDTNSIKLLFSIKEISNIEPSDSMKNAEHYINHISINPSGTRFLFFHVWLILNKRFTRLITSDLDGNDPYVLYNEEHVSHYTWKSDLEILCFSTHRNSGSRYHLYTDKNIDYKIIGNGLLCEDGHPSFSPNKELIITDTYPDKYGERNLLLYNDSKQSLNNIGKFYSPFKYQGESRCDLHPRWNRTGSHVVIDSAHEGQRGMYILKI